MLLSHYYLLTAMAVRGALLLIEPETEAGVRISGHRTQMTVIISHIQIKIYPDRYERHQACDLQCILMCNRKSVVISPLNHATRRPLWKGCIMIYYKKKELMRCQKHMPLISVYSDYFKILFIEISTD